MIVLIFVCSNCLISLFFKEIYRMITRSTEITKVNVVFISVFVSPAKQKRDICTAFPASSSSSASSAA